MDDQGEQLLYRVETAAKLYELGRSKMWELIASGEIPSIRIGRARRIRARDLREWVEKQAVAAE